MKWSWSWAWVLVGCVEHTEPLLPIPTPPTAAWGQCYPEAFYPCVTTPLGPCTTARCEWVVDTPGTECEACPACTGLEPVPTVCRTDLDCPETDYCLHVCVPLTCPTP